MITKRQTALLSVFNHLDKEVPNTDFMKLCFLIRHETKFTSHSPFYDFVPYKFGPFSFSIYRDLEKLSALGFIRFSPPQQLKIESRALVQDAVATFNEGVGHWVEEIIKKYGDWSTNKIVKYVYSTFPWYALLSEHRLAPKDQQRPSTQPAVYTVGYEGESIDSLTNKLIEKGIQRVVDVRRNPLSRKYGFSKTAMNRIFGNLAIEYVHVPQAGISSSERAHLDTYQDYQNLLNKYEETQIPEMPEAVEEIAALTREKPSALLCFENDVQCCHRGRLAKAVSKAADLPVVHI